MTTVTPNKKDSNAEREIESNSTNHALYIGKSPFTFAPCVLENENT
jgi:hypothetical protein